jgi:hypothetical protein
MGRGIDRYPKTRLCYVAFVMSSITLISTTYGPYYGKPSLQQPFRGRHYCQEAAAGATG